MRFKTLSEYDDEIKKIDKMIDNWEKYIKTKNFSKPASCQEVCYYHSIKIKRC